MPLQPCQVLPQLPRAQAAGTHPSCLRRHPPGKPSQQLAEIWHFLQIQQLFPARSSSASLPMSTFASIITQQKTKD